MALCAVIRWLPLDVCWAYFIRGSSRWVSRQYFLSQQKCETKFLEQKNKEIKPTTDWREDQFCWQPSSHSPPPGLAITFPSQGNQCIFSTKRHNPCRGWCCSLGKISLNFALVAFMNAKTSHGLECGWLTQCQPWFYDCFLPSHTQTKQQSCAQRRYWWWYMSLPLAVLLLRQQCFQWWRAPSSSNGGHVDAVLLLVFNSRRRATVRLPIPMMTMTARGGGGKQWWGGQRQWWGGVGGQGRQQQRWQR
jgi:hypothetical protein